MTEELTAESLERATVHIANPVGLRPTRLVVPRTVTALFVVTHRAFDEGWDRRRLKRELRRADISTYHKW